MQGVLLTLTTLILVFISMETSTAFSSRITPPAIQLSYRQNEIRIEEREEPKTTTISHPKNPPVPPVLFLHGLDSSSHTWRTILSELKTPAVAVDLRGCGKSDLGNADEFSPNAIVKDLYEFVSGHEYFQIEEGDGANQQKRKFVLCGHSMGGRIAMSYAAKYPEQISALIIEDMDIRVRPMSMNMFQRKIPNRDETIAFERKITTDSIDDVTELFVKEGYPEDSVKKWLSEGRITKNPTTPENNDKDDDVSYYFSEVNPAFRLLCYEQFFMTNHGEDTWNEIVQDKPEYSFPCHIMVAGKDGTVCDNESIWKMQTMMKTKNDLRMIVHRYEDATHSIHDSAQRKFMEDLNQIILNSER